MSITRANAAAYLASEYSNLAAAIGLSTSDDASTGYGPDIDNALRKLDNAESALSSATVADGDREKFYALCEYYFSRRAWRQLSDRPNVSIESDRFDFSKMLTNAKKLMEDARERAESLGVGVGVASWGEGALTLDWVEPTAV